MDDTCGEWMECMGVVSRRWVWLVGVGGIYDVVISVGGIYGCGCKDIDLLVALIRT